MSLRAAVEFGAAAALAAFSIGVAAQALPYGVPISLENAKKAAAAAAAESRKNHWGHVIAVTDAAGDLVYFERPDGPGVQSGNVAIGKARSAARFKRPTKSFQDRLVAGDGYLVSLEGAVLVGGGVPLVMDGKIVGAIGSSGGTAAQDDQVSNAGAAALK
jgi:glc operon protein GlcG